MPKPTAMWLRLRNVPRLRALRLEEALYRTDRRPWLITCETDGADGDAVAAAHASSQAIVLGISGKPEEMVHADRVEAAQIPLIKRFTGGGTVVCDANTLFVTFIGDEGAPAGVAAYPEPILRWAYSREWKALAPSRCAQSTMLAARPGRCRPLSAPGDGLGPTGWWRRPQICVVLAFVGCR